VYFFLGVWWLVPLKIGQNATSSTQSLKGRLLEKALQVSTMHPKGLEATILPNCVG